MDIYVLRDKNGAWLRVVTSGPDARQALSAKDKWNAENETQAVDVEWFPPHAVEDKLAQARILGVPGA